MPPRTQPTLLRNARTAWMLTLLALVGFAILTYWTVDVEVASPGSAHTAGDPSAPDSAMAGNAAADTTPIPGERVAASATARRDASTPPVPAGHVLVRVFDAATGEPAAGAEVVADDPARDRPFQAAELAQYVRLGPFERLHRFGQRTTSDRDGFAVLAGTDWMDVAARRGDAFAFATLQMAAAEPRGFALWLQRDDSVQVRVVDRTGAPVAAAPVTLELTYTQPGQDPERVREEPVYTDADGIVVLHHLQRYAELQTPSHRAASLDAPGLCDTRVELTPGARQVELRLPAFAPVHIVVQDARGRALPDAPAWRVHLWGPETTTKGADRKLWTLPGQNGSATLPCVAVGVQLQAKVDIDGDAAARTLAGPSQDRVAAEHVLRLLPSGRTTVRGRLVDERGPLGDTDMLVRRSDDPWSLVFFTSDAAGHFAVGLDLGPANGDSGGVTLEMRTRLPGRAPLVAPPCVVQAAGETDLGDVRLEPAQPIAIARLVGTPPRLPGLTADVEIAEGSDDWGYSAWYPTQHVGDEVRIFEIGVPPQGKLRLVLHVPGCQPIAPIPFARGDRDLRVELLPGATLTARIVAEPWLLRAIAGDSVRIVLVDEHGATRELSSTANDGGLTIHQNDLAPGLHRLEVHGDLPIREVKDIQVGPMAAADPRLDPLDLRGAVRCQRVRARDSLGGDPQDSGVVFVRDPRSLEWVEVRGIDPRTRTAEVLVPAVPLDVCFASNGTVSPVVRAVGDVECVVQAACAVQLRLEPWFPLRDGAACDVEFECGEGRPPLREVPFDESPCREVEFDPARGTFTITLTDAIAGHVVVTTAAGEIARLPIALQPVAGLVALPLPAAVQRALEPLRAPR